MAEETINQNRSVIVSLNPGNNYFSQLNLRPSINQVAYGRILASKPCIIETDIFKPVYFLNQANSLEAPINQFFAQRDIAYKTAVDQVDFQYVKLVEPASTSVELLIEFFQAEPPHNIL